MTRRISATIIVLAALAAAMTIAQPARVTAQGRGGAQARPGQATAPIDLTGYWAAIVSQDWRWRMVTPAKGDYASVPITAAAKQAADAWDPAKDEAAGESCKSYGAPAIMRVPARLHITWQDDTTLKVDIDNGQQTRLFHFGDWKPANGGPTLQGDSVAAWETPPVARGAPPPKTGSLKVVTRNLKAGYLRKNGVPHSADAVYTEYWDLGEQRDGSLMITLTTTVEDPLYLREPWLTVLTFRKEADGSKWSPEPCSAR